MKVLLIDDEPLAISLLQEYLASEKDLEVVGTCNDGFEGVKAIQKHDPDLLFLDIQMPRINGFEMLELLDKVPYVIFTTAFDQYALQAFENNALDYLLKPFSKERLDKALSKFRQLQAAEEKQNTARLGTDVKALAPGQQERIVVKTGGKIRIIPLHEIYYLQASDDYVEVHTEEAKFLKSKTMQYFEDTLPANFVRVHRSYIVNIDLVTRIEAYEKDSHIVVLKNAARIPVSRNGYSVLRQALGL